MDSSILFGDLDSPAKPSVVDGSLHSNKSEQYAGEAIVKQSLKNGTYRVATHGNRVYDARAAFNIGENILPTGIAVFIVANNGQAWILGRLRPANDSEDDAGDTDTDRSSTIGNNGDAQLRPHSLEDSAVTGEVTVTAGNVVRVRSTSSTNIMLYPQGEQILQRSQRLLAFTDAYRIESGRKAGKTGGVSFDTITTQSYKTVVGPARTEVRIKNGKVEGDVVHRLTVDTLATTAGRTTGTSNFAWDIESNGLWQVYLGSAIKLGDASDEPVVLGNQLVSHLKELIAQMTSLRSSIATYSGAVAAAGVATTMALAGPWGSTGSVLKAALLALSSVLTSQGISLTAGAAASSTGISASQAKYLTAAGPVAEKILSDFVSTQKTPPIPSVVSE